MGFLDATGAMLVAVASAVVVLMLLIAGTRAATVVSRRREQRTRSEVLPVVLAVTDGEDPPLPAGHRLRRTMGQVAASMSHKVRGADREALGAWLREHGFLEEARRGMRSHSAVRRARAAQLYVAAAPGGDPAPVVALLRDPHPGVRATAVQALGHARAVDALPALVRAVGGRMAGVTMSGVAMAIVQAAPTRADQLDAAWTSPDPRVRRLAVDAAGYLGLADARTRLEEALAGTDPTLRLRAAVALGRIGSPASVPALSIARSRAALGSAERREIDAALAQLGPAGRGV